ncbi:hypothetical protein BDV93DRAFT_153348 [Ceratobasidium sp. AG-I]|nr:hypothetical protein BDV93DRAFT_153348 [Ceratobasidium sp. AG-I]
MIGASPLSASLTTFHLNLAQGTPALILDGMLANVTSAQEPTTSSTISTTHESRVWLDIGHSIFTFGIQPLGSSTHLQRIHLAPSAHTACEKAGIAKEIRNSP